MSQLFEGELSFNEDISAWDTSGVTNMQRMFETALAFNQNIIGWLVNNVRDMHRMFDSASSFNQNIGGWLVNNVRDMHRMFDSASAFDQDLGWCVDTGVDVLDIFLCEHWLFELLLHDRQLRRRHLHVLRGLKSTRARCR